MFFFVFFFGGGVNFKIVHIFESIKKPYKEPSPTGQEEAEFS
jgi:hypothetical protein